jgi:hypothetical protein
MASVTKKTTKAKTKPAEAKTPASKVELKDPEVPKFDKPYATVVLEPQFVKNIGVIVTKMEEQGYTFFTQIDVSAFSRAIYLLFKRKV